MINPNAMSWIRCKSNDETGRKFMEVFREEQEKHKQREKEQKNALHVDGFFLPDGWLNGNRLTYNPNQHEFYPREGNLLACGRFGSEYPLEYTLYRVKKVSEGMFGSVYLHLKKLESRKLIYDRDIQQQPESE